MPRRLLMISLLVIPPTLFVGLNCRKFLSGLSLDTSPAIAQRIRPGMSMVEAERMIGGPPGDYCYKPWVGFDTIRWTLHKDWTTHRGSLRIVYGSWGIGTGVYGPNVRVSLPRGKGDHGSWSKQDGTVWAVEWYPSHDPDGPFWFAVYCVACALGWLAVFAVARDVWRNGLWPSSRTPPAEWWQMVYIASVERRHQSSLPKSDA